MVVSLCTVKTECCISLWRGVDGLLESLYHPLVYLDREQVVNGVSGTRFAIAYCQIVSDGAQFGPQPVDVVPFPYPLPAISFVVFLGSL